MVDGSATGVWRTSSCTVELTDAAKDYVVDSGYDPVLRRAARCKRFLQRAVETAIARKLVADEVAPRSRLVVDLSNGEITVNVMPPEPAVR